MDKPADKAREQMRSMGLSAPYIGSEETRTEEEIKADRKTLAENVPILGEAILAKEIADDVKDENYLSAGLNTAALAVGAIPGVGDILNKPIRAAAKKLRKADKDAATKMLSDVDSIETWKKQNPNPKPQKQNPDVEKSANDLLEGKITGKQHRSVVKENMPIVKIDEVPEMPSFTEIVGALDKDKSAKGILGLNKSVKDGTRVSSRLDIPAYERFDKWVVSVHDAFDKKGRESLNGDIVGYGKTAILKNVDFKGLPQGAANIAAKRNPKGTIARIFGDYYNAEPENVAEYAKQVIKNKNWTQVGYNPFRHGFFYDKNTGMPVKSAEEVIQVGPLVLAKNVKKIKISEAKQVGPKGGLKIRTGKPIEGLQNLKETKTVFNKGGAVPMNSMAKQMDMFDEGGLMDEGGTVDPVSGNDVPPGSTQEEVRDDIPAQLSEGEFVFPADVVRFIGLEKLMKIRQRAKAGLQRMEDMGQMGNSEEAIMPDTLPFSIEDLDMEDEDEYNTPQEFNQGGMPDPNAGVYYNPALKPTTGVAPAPVTAASSNIARSIPIAQAATPMQAGSSNQPAMFNNYQLPQAPVPTMPQRDDLPPFLGGVVPGVGSGIDFNEEIYVNDAGQTITFRRYKDGSLKDMQGNVAVIPEGYKIKSEADKDVGTGPVKVESATVQEEGDRDQFKQDQEDMKRDQARVDAAKTMNFTNFAGIGQGILSTLGVATLPEGTVTGIGFVSDGKGNMFDPLTGRPIANSIKDALKNSWNEISSILKGEDGLKENDRFTQNLIAKGKEQETKFGRDFYKAAGVAKVDRVFAGIKDDIKDGKYGQVNFDDFSENYIDNVQKSIREQAEKGNYITDEGRIANQFEVGGARVSSGKGLFKDPSASFAINKTETERAFSKETASEAASRDAANREQAARQQAARDALVDREEGGDFGGDGGVGESDGGGYGSDAGTGGGGDMGVICLTEDMKVNRNGVIDFVTNVKVGDIVDNTVVTEVLHKHMREGYYVVNGELKITNDHPVLANGSWKRTENLVLGDYINNVEVTSLEYLEQVTPTVYIGTADDRYNVYTKGEVYTVHGQYKNALKKAA